MRGEAFAREAQMVVMDCEGGDIEIEAKVLLLGGEPIAGYGPFVMNYEGEIKQAMLDYHSCKFGSMPQRRPEGATTY